MALILLGAAPVAADSNEVTLGGQPIEDAFSRANLKTSFWIDTRTPYPQDDPNVGQQWPIWTAV